MKDFKVRAERSLFQRLRDNLIFVAIIGVIVAAIFVYPILYWSSQEAITIQVTDREREAKDSGSRYIVHTPGEVFECADSWLYFKFNSSDVYSELQRGGKYRVLVAGWRIPLLSWYRNIIEVTGHYRLARPRVPEEETDHK